MDNPPLVAQRLLTLSGAACGLGAVKPACRTLGLVLAPLQQREWLANSRMRGRPMPGSLWATLDLHLHRSRTLRLSIKKPP